MAVMNGSHGVRDLCELRTRRPGSVDVGRGEHDLDVRRQHLRARTGIADLVHHAGVPARRLVDDAPDRGGRSLRAAAIEPQQRQARMRVVTLGSRPCEGLLGCPVLTPQTVQFAPLVVRHPARRARQLRQPVAGPIGLVDRLGPVAPQPGQLGAVHEALPTEGDQIGLAGAPAAQRCRPLLGPPQVEELLAGPDHRAVDEAGR
jgi:hypothetical protein